MVGAPSFSQSFLCIQPPLQCPPQIRSSTSVNFYLPSSPLLSLQSPLTLPSYMPQKFFTSPFLHATNPIIYNKIFSLPQPFSLFRLLQGIKELCSLVTNNTVLISSFFLKVWTVITGLAITNSLLLRLRKLVCYG